MSSLGLGAGIAVTGTLAAVLLISTLLRYVDVRPPPPPPPALATELPRVQVLNGCGVRGAANAAASELRTAGAVDVVAIGNASGVQLARTVVLDRGGHRAQAEYVARLLGVDDVLVQRGSAAGADITVVVGFDQGRWEQN